MAEYIEREAAIATACEGCNKEFPNEPCEPADCAIQQGLFKIPAADVVEVRHGRLENIVDFGECNCFGYCSVCGTEHRASNPTALKMSYRHCRWCGAKMDGKGETDG